MLARSQRSQSAPGAAGPGVPRRGAAARTGFGHAARSVRRVERRGRSPPSARWRRARSSPPSARPASGRATLLAQAARHTYPRDRILSASAPAPTDVADVAGAVDARARQGPHGGHRARRRHAAAWVADRAAGPGPAIADASRVTAVRGDRRAVRRHSCRAGRLVDTVVACHRFATARRRAAAGALTSRRRARGRDVRQSRPRRGRCSSYEWPGNVDQLHAVVTRMRPAAPTSSTWSGLPSEVASPDGPWFFIIARSLAETKRVPTAGHHRHGHAAAAGVRLAGGRGFDRADLLGEAGHRRHAGQPGQRRPAVHARGRHLLERPRRQPHRRRGVPADGLADQRQRQHSAGNRPAPAKRGRRRTATISSA